MREITQTSIADLSPPRQDEDTLIWPSPQDILAAVETNRRVRSTYAFRLLDVSVRERFAALRSSPTSIMTGHQPAFFHPGVWAKNVAAAKLAERLRGQASFLVVDSDSPAQTILEWPVGSSGNLNVCRVSTPASTQHLSYEQLGPWADLVWDDVFSRVSETLAHSSRPRHGSHSDNVLPGFARSFSAAQGAPSQNPSSYLDRWTQAMETVESALGVAPPAYHRVSGHFSARPTAETVSGLTFAAHLILQAAEFATAHNLALNQYRERRRIRGTRHPIPDLGMEEDRVELPFWIMRAAQPRARLWVSAGQTGATHGSPASQATDIVHLWADRAPVCSLSPDELRRDPHRVLAEHLGEWAIRPRALTLTMYARLFLCDIFIHGIGGAKYDQITDDIIRRFFNVEPPTYACVSATLHLPLPAVPDLRMSDHRTAMRRLRDIRWNPQRHILESAAPHLAPMMAERAAAVAEAQRLRSIDPANRLARREAYLRIRRSTAALSQETTSMCENADRDARRILTAVTQNAIAMSREWFFALHPKANLEGLRDSILF